MVGEVVMHGHAGKPETYSYDGSLDVHALMPQHLQEKVQVRSSKQAC